MNNSQRNQLFPIKALAQLKVIPINIKYEYERYGNIWLFLANVMGIYLPILKYHIVK